MSATYPLFVAAGEPRDLGRAHGEQVRGLIHGFLDWLLSTLGLSQAVAGERALSFLPLFERHCPHLVTEVAGLAEGAKLDFSLALALQLRGELANVPHEACTAFVISPEGTARGEVLAGQTSDTPAEIEDLGYCLNLRPARGLELLMWTFGGMIGYHGLNAAGVAHFANSLGGGPGFHPGLSHYPLKRLLLECRDLASARSLIEGYPVCSNGNYVLCDGSGALLDCELTTAGPLWLEHPGDGFLVHSNHFLCAPEACAENHARSLPDSFGRLERLRSLIAGRFGTLTVDDVKAMLADHAGYPVGICRHPHDGPGDAVLPASGKTVAALVAEPARGLLHVARGNPCERPYVTYSLGGGC